MNLSQTILGLPFEHPIIAASGKWAWTAAEWSALWEAGAAGVTTKSFWNHVHEGNPDPVITEESAWTLNAVGLPDRGPEDSGAELAKALPDPPKPLIVSILGLSAEEYAANAARVAAMRPSAIEVNLSSPTFLKLKGGYSAEEILAILPAVKAAAGSIPVFAKLSPNVPDIGPFAAACVASGADGITAINTLGTGLSIDLETRRPRLSVGKGGLSGPGIKPLAVRCVRDVYEATGGSVPIIGAGGVMTGEDAAELILAGASIVALATAVLREGPSACGRVRDELSHTCGRLGIADVGELRGAMRS